MSVRANAEMFGRPRRIRFGRAYEFSVRIWVNLRLVDRVLIFSLIYYLL
jgi:hypothetical protein